MMHEVSIVRINYGWWTKVKYLPWSAAILYMLLYIIEAFASAFWSFRILEDAFEDVYFYLLPIIILGLVLYYISRGIYQITGKLLFNDDQVAIVDGNDKRVELKWSQFKFAELEHVQGIFYILRFGDNQLYLKLGYEMRYELKSLLKDKLVLIKDKDIPYI